MNVFRKITKARIFRSKGFRGEIEPDEIFLDSENLPEFDRQQFEGRIESPIARSAIIFLSGFFFLAASVLLGRAWFLQIARGASYAEQSENNRLAHTPIFAKRGIVSDRTGTELTWNVIEEGEEFPGRAYARAPGIAHTVGYVSYPLKDAKGFYYREGFEAKDGIEKFYDGRLAGENGIRLVEVDALGNVRSASVIAPPVDGENVTLALDLRVQSALYGILGSFARERGFEGGGGVIMDTKTGEILALTSFPEYSPEILSRGDDAAAIRAFVGDSRKPFLNRVTSGLYAPGSTVKPFVALGALHEQVINPLKKILSTGSISIPNPYYPEIVSVFRDWKAHGWVDMRAALAVSSDVYFYEIGGGFEDQRGIGIYNIQKYAKLFGLAEPTGIDMPGEAGGVIPGPEWKAETFKGDPWRVGDTYNTAIGQYGFQITPLQLARAIAAIAEGGTLVRPRMVLGAPPEREQLSLSIDPEYYRIVREGMRQAVTNGTAAALSGAAVPIAAKTGTAELGVSKRFVNSWITGFFPYENPRFAFTLVLERGPRENLVGAPAAMRQLFDWMAAHTPEYLE